MTKAKKEDLPVVSLDEQKKLAKDELKKLIELSAKKESLTIEEINEALAPELIASEALDLVMHGLEVQGVSRSSRR